MVKKIPDIPIHFQEEARNILIFCYASLSPLTCPSQMIWAVRLLAARLMHSASSSMSGVSGDSSSIFITMGIQSVYVNMDLALSSIDTWYRIHSTISLWFSLSEINDNLFEGG